MKQPALAGHVNQDPSADDHAEDVEIFFQELVDLVILENTQVHVQGHVLAEPWALRPRTGTLSDIELVEAPPCDERDLEVVFDPTTSHDNPR